LYICEQMEKEIIHLALENLKRTTSFTAVWEETKLLDGVLKFNINDKKKTFNIEIKKEVRPYQVQAIQQQFQDIANFMLLAERIYPKVKNELQTFGVPYIEANGNIFIKAHDFFILIDTQKPIQLTKQDSNRAFTKTGLKVVFQILINSDLINKTYREIADAANVGLGTIPKVIQGLLETGFLLKINPKEYLLNNKEELLNRWINTYNTALKPKLKKGNFRLKQDWKNVKFNHATVWGGEAAADLLTNHLRPEKFLIYTNENLTDLIKNYGLIPDKKGEVEILERFWHNETKKPIAPALLIYADLVLQGGKRNLETAQMIYDEHIQSNL